MPLRMSYQWAEPAPRAPGRRNLHKNHRSLPGEWPVGCVQCRSKPTWLPWRDMPRDASRTMATWRAACRQAEAAGGVGRWRAALRAAADVAGHQPAALQHLWRRVAGRRAALCLHRAPCARPPPQDSWANPLISMKGLISCTDQLGGHVGCCRALQTRGKRAPPPA